MNAKTILRLTSARLETFDLSPTEAFVLTRIDGASALGDVADLTGVPIARVITIARRLERLGAVGAVHEKTAEKTAPEPQALTDHHLPLRPRRTASDVYRMKLDAGDAFLLSCVDGQLSIAELADLVGWAQDRALRSMAALLAHGAVELDRVAPARTSKAPAARRTQRPRTVRPRPRTKAPPAPVTPDPAPVSAVEAETAAKIEAALRAIAAPTLHAVLGVAEGATAKELRRAYFERAATLHPDRYFGKELGPYRRRLDDAFKRLTDAYESLRRDAPRRRPTVAPAKAPTKAPPKIPTKLPPKNPSIRPSKRPSMRASKAPRKPSSAKLAASAPAPQPVKDVSARSSPTAASVAATSKAAQFMMDAQKALNDGNAASAANLFRLALQITVDPNTRAIAETGLDDARAALADSYAKSARAAEKKSQWAAAVEAYGKAVQHRPNDAELCERLANALHEVGHDLTRAAAMAESAVARAPRRAAFRRTLGRIHAAAGQRALALEQLEAAVALEPDDETRSLIAKLRKHG